MIMKMIREKTIQHTELYLNIWKLHSYIFVSQRNEVKNMVAAWRKAPKYKSPSYLLEWSSNV